MFKRYIAALAVLIIVNPFVFAGLDSKKAAYMGGTVAAFASSKKVIEGTIDTSNNDEMRFVYKMNGNQHWVAIPYAKVIDLEYGQKAGRRVGMAVGTTILLGPIGLLSLLSKKRKHYLTIGFKDNEDKDQVAVFELGKDIVRTTLAITQTRSGKEMQYQDESARKHAKGN